MHAMQVQAGAPLIPSPVSNDAPTARPTSRRPLFVALVTSAVLVYVADQLTKAWVSANLEPDRPRELLGSVLQLNLTRNPGAAFSIGTGSTWILTAIACAVVVFIVITARRLGSQGWAMALGLLLGGSLGNLTDRMFRAPGPGRGHVVDFMQLPHWPIFNVADSAIVSAAVLIALLAFRGISVDGSRTSEHTAKHHAPEHHAPEHHEPEHQTPVDQSPLDQPPMDQPSKHEAGTTHDG
jgi:signal peptidase II